MLAILFNFRSDAQSNSKYKSNIYADKKSIKWHNSCNEEDSISAKVRCVKVLGFMMVSKRVSLLRMLSRTLTHLSTQFFSLSLSLYAVYWSTEFSTDGHTVSEKPLTCVEEKESFMCIRCVIMIRVNCKGMSATIIGSSGFALCCLAFCSSIRSIPVFPLRHLCSKLCLHSDCWRLASASQQQQSCRVLPVCVDCVI